MYSLFEDSDFGIHERLIIKSLRDLISQIPTSKGWSNVFKKFSNSSHFERFERFLIDEYSSNYCFPKPENIFRAFKLTGLEDVKVVILGQDPYHGIGQADGLAFSVPERVKTPPSLRNIFVELSDDIGGARSTDLSNLANQGVLLLNSCLSVRSSEAGSHRDKGWELLIYLVLQEINEYKSGVCFILWGKDAEVLGNNVDLAKHKLFISAHPSPLSAYRGFFGSKPFSNVNNALIELGENEINWLM